MKSHLAIALILGAVAAAPLTSGCNTRYLPHTEIKDTPETRGVYDVLMMYKRAMEDREVDRLLPIISRNYYENNGTTDDKSDDYGYERLVKVVLPQLKENIKNVQYRMILSDIEVDGDRAWASYEFYFIYKFVEGGNVGHDSKNDFNRIDLAREGDAWKIIAGL